MASNEPKPTPTLAPNGRARGLFGEFTISGEGRTAGAMSA